MAFLDVEHIKQLKKLFKPPTEGEDSDSDGSCDHDTVRQIGPGDIGESKNTKTKKKYNNDPDEHVKNCSYALLEKDSSNQPNTIEEWEQQQQQECEALLDSRPRPDYKITYKQTVCTEDLYLQMSGKTPSTASCENMVIEIFLTNETVGIHHMDLSVHEQRIVLKTPKYYMDLQLPHKVDPDKGNAAWLSVEKILKLTLKMEREFDFINF
ncbi:dynein axonemal assembly factor 6 isoform X2 [Topomyia yanbarensis]|uniref:dynein axonemal assembly factor 6 isoform X2 n=1 Tax=Topomyia yanbarensis TaxID=2498891 RepID=UPI00273BFFE0|nr:dynein axonemal assembly factor 6 isoform X2 [Topomyia yanbarensis]